VAGLPPGEYDAFKGDVWALGVCMFTAATGKLPYSPYIANTRNYRKAFRAENDCPAFAALAEENWGKFWSYHESKGLHLDRLMKDGPGFKQCIQGMMTWHPMRRVSMRAMMSNPWLWGDKDDEIDSEVVAVDFDRRVLGEREAAARAAERGRARVRAARERRGPGASHAGAGAGTGSSRGGASMYDSPTDTVTAPADLTAAADRSRVASHGPSSADSGHAGRSATGGGRGRIDSGSGSGATVAAGGGAGPGPGPGPGPRASPGSSLPSYGAPYMESGDDVMRSAKLGDRSLAIIELDSVWEGDCEVVPHSLLAGWDQRDAVVALGGALEQLEGASIRSVTQAIGELGGVTSVVLEGAAEASESAGASTPPGEREDEDVDKYEDKEDDGGLGVGHLMRREEEEEGSAGTFHAKVSLQLIKSMVGGKEVVTKVVLLVGQLIEGGSVRRLQELIDRIAANLDAARAGSAVVEGAGAGAGL